MFKAPELSALSSEALGAGPALKRPRRSAQNAGKRSLPELKSLSPNSNRLNLAPFYEPATLAASMLELEEVAFKLPSSASSIPSPAAKSSASSGLSSPPTSLIDDMTPVKVKSTTSEHDIPEVPSKVEAASESSHILKCPICKAPVDSLFLSTFTGNRRLTVREQAEFCQGHKRRTADKEWQAKGYPKIDWPCLHMQVKIHSETIDEILKGERFSYYRNAYDDYLKREKHRTLRQSLVQGGGIEDFSPGYYGSRGAKIMHVSIPPS